MHDGVRVRGLSCDGVTQALEIRQMIVTRRERALTSEALTKVNQRIFVALTRRGHTELLYPSRGL